MSKPSQFGTPYQFDMPQNTDEEDAAIEADNAKFVPAHFVNHGRVAGEVWTRRVLASSVAKAFIPAILLLLVFLAFGWRP